MLRASLAFAILWMKRRLSGSGSPGGSSTGGIKKIKTADGEEFELHYKKDGSLDMRFKSSKEFLDKQKGGSFAVSRNPSKKNNPTVRHISEPIPIRPTGGTDNADSVMHPPVSAVVPLSASQRGNRKNITNYLMNNARPQFDDQGCKLNYTRSGKLDLRYSNSKRFMEFQRKKGSLSGMSDTNPAALTKDHASRVPSAPKTIPSEQPQTEGQIHPTNGESSELMPEEQLPSAENKDDQPKEVQNQPLIIIQSEVPADIPKTRTKLPDMRTKLAKDWVENQAKEHGQLNTPAVPSWIPRQKDGTIDMSKQVVHFYLETKGKHTAPMSLYDGNRRRKYYENKLKDKKSDFYRFLKQMQEEHVREETFMILNNEELVESYKNETDIPGQDLRPEYVESTSPLSPCDSSSVTDEDDFQIPTYIPELDYDTLSCTIRKGKKGKLGNGAFGIVYKGYYRGDEVAIKKLFLDPKSTGDKQIFIQELKILAAFGTHKNLVTLIGYTLDPATIVMEYVKLGSLYDLLYFTENDMIEAKLCDGRIKKRIVSGIINGMRQLHSVSVIHGDLKPANILVTEDFSAKIADFGLARIRGKTQSLVASNMRQDEGENLVAGTAAYMAPELLEPGTVEYPVDVYSFGVVLNEIIHEEEPYAQDYEEFRGRGPFGVVNYAKTGRRPYIDLKLVGGKLFLLIISCWNNFAEKRPKFDELVEELMNPELVFPSLVSF